MRFKLVSLLANALNTLSARPDVVEWRATKYGLHPMFVTGGWDMVNAALLSVVEDFMVADAAGRAGKQMEGRELLSGIAELSGAAPLLDQWALLSMTAETESKNAFYYAKPNAGAVAVHRISFNMMYPRIMMMMWSKRIINSEDLFFLVYFIIVHYRSHIKAISSKSAYMLLKMYVNSFYGHAKNSADQRAWGVMVQDYAWFVMQSLVNEIGESRVLYVDTDVMYADVSMVDMQAAAHAIGSGLPYEIEYVTEFSVSGFRSYRAKLISGVEKHNIKT